MNRSGLQASLSTRCLKCGKPYGIRVQGANVLALVLQCPKCGERYCMTVDGAYRAPVAAPLPQQGPQELRPATLVPEYEQLARKTVDELLGDLRHPSEPGE